MERDGKILEWTVTKPALDQASGTSNSARWAWATLAIIAEFSAEHPTHGPAWLNTSDVAILLSQLEDTSLHRIIRTFRDSMDFFTLGVSE